MAQLLDVLKSLHSHLEEKHDLIVNELERTLPKDPDSELGGSLTESLSRLRKSLRSIAKISEDESLGLSWFTRDELFPLLETLYSGAKATHCQSLIDLLKAPLPSSRLFLVDCISHFNHTRVWSFLLEHPEVIARKAVPSIGFQSTGADNGIAAVFKYRLGVGYSARTVEVPFSVDSLPENLEQYLGAGETFFNEARALLLSRVEDAAFWPGEAEQADLTHKAVYAETTKHMEELLRKVGYLDWERLKHLAETHRGAFVEAARASLSGNVLEALLDTPAQIAPRG